MDLSNAAYGTSRLLSVTQIKFAEVILDMEPRPQPSVDQLVQPSATKVMVSTRSALKINPYAVEITDSLASVALRTARVTTQPSVVIAKLTQ